MKKALRYTFAGFLSLVLLTIIVIPFIPADSYREEIDTRLTEMVGMPVTLGDISLTSLPVPGIRIRDARLFEGDRSLLAIDNILIAPRLSSLFSDEPEIRKIQLSGLRLHAKDIERLMALVEKQPSSGTETPGINIKRISADDNVIQLDQSRVLGPFRFEAKLSKASQLQVFDLSLEEQSVKLNLTADADNFVVQLHASDWKLQVDPAPTISSLQANGLLQPDKLHMDDINIVAYQGHTKGNLIVNWQKQWEIDSHMEIVSLNLKDLLKDLGHDAMDGTMSGKFTIRAAAKAPDMLIDKTYIAGNMKITDGHIYNTDLEKAVRTMSSEWTTSGQTPFDEFKSRVDMTMQKVRLSDLKITSSVLAAEGKMDIMQMNQLDGRINVGLNDPTGIINMPLMIAGTVEAPKVRPTDEALAGGAIGTAILGPGVGTAVGVKAGEFFGKIGGLFGSDDDEKKTTPKPAQNNDSTFDEDY